MDHSKSKKLITPLCLASFSLVFVFLTLRTSAQENIVLPAPNSILNHNYQFGGTPLGNPENAKSNLDEIYKQIILYRKSTNGLYFSSPSEMLKFIGDSQAKNLDQYNAIITKMMNPDSRYSDSQDTRLHATSSIPYYILSRRPDGETYDHPREIGAKDVLSYTDLYFHNYEERIEKGPRTGFYGFYVVLWDDGKVERVPFDQTVTVFNGDQGHTGFVGQAGIPFDALSFEESDSYSTFAPIRKPLVKNHIVEDNGGPESLVNLSRSLSLPDAHGIDRGDLWATFSPSQAEFTLADLNAGATRLGVDTQVQRISLTQLQKNGSPALLFLKDDGRIVALTALDDNHALVVDRGLTHIVKRNVLEERYSGEALVPVKSLTQSASITVDDSVRQLQPKSPNDEIPQQFILHNTGTKPLAIQLQYPLLGVTESKLSKGLLAPGETATLDLKIKWRSTLKSSTQNVFVSLQTNDPIVPRLQLAILLDPKLPQATK